MNGDTRDAGFTAPDWLLCAGTGLAILQALSRFAGEGQVPAVLGLGSALLVLSFAAWAYLSEAQPECEMSFRYVCVLMVLGIGLRLLGAGGRIKTMELVALKLEAYALGVLVGAQQHRRQVSPIWLTLLFLLSLPLERTMQRLIAQGLQGLPAGGSSNMLSSF